MTIALALILVSAVVHAVVNVLTKRADDKYAMRLLIGVFSAVLVTPALFFVAPPHGIVVWLLIATAFVHAIYELLLVKSYESAAFSAVYPVARGTGPLFTALGAIFILREHAPAIELLGIVLVCGGVITIGLSHRATDGALTGLAYALGTGLTIGIYTLIDATGGKVLASASTLEKDVRVSHPNGAEKEAATEVGNRSAEKAKATGVTAGAVARAGVSSHGRVTERAEAAGGDARGR